MSALPKFNGTRSSSAIPGTAYDDLRSKVASLVRPERSVVSTSQQALPPTVLRPSLEEAVPVLTGRQERPDHGRDTNSVFEILNRATSCFDLLTQKLDQVEGEREEALAQIEEHKRAVAGWQEMIETVQARMQDAERDMATMRQEIASQTERADAAEQRAEQLDSTLRLRERRLGEVEKQYASLYDQVMNSFGSGSATQRVLENLIQKFHSKAA